MINLITDLISFTQPTNLDKESLSVIESIAKIKNKVNECINEFNNLETKTTNDYNNFIKQLNKYYDDLTSKYNELLKSNTNFKNEFKCLIEDIENFNVTLDYIKEQSKLVQDIAKQNQDNIDKGTIATQDQIKEINSSIKTIDNNKDSYFASFLGFKFDGTDETEILKQALVLKNNMRIIFPNNVTILVSEPIIIENNGLEIIGNGTLIKLKDNSGALLRMSNREFVNRHEVGLLNITGNNNKIRNLRIDTNMEHNYYEDNDGKWYYLAKPEDGKIPSGLNSSGFDGIKMVGDNLLVENCKILNASWCGITIGDDHIPSNNVIIKDNTVKNCTQDCISLLNTHKVEVYNNETFDTYWHHIHAYNKNSDVKIHDNKCHITPSFSKIKLYPTYTNTNTLQQMINIAHNGYTSMETKDVELYNNICENKNNLEVPMGIYVHPLSFVRNIRAHDNTIINTSVGIWSDIYHYGKLLFERNTFVNINKPYAIMSTINIGNDHGLPTFTTEIPKCDIYVNDNNYINCNYTIVGNGTDNGNKHSSYTKGVNIYSNNNKCIGKQAFDGYEVLTDLFPKVNYNKDYRKTELTLLNGWEFTEDFYNSYTILENIRTIFLSFDITKGDNYVDGNIFYIRGLNKEMRFPCTQIVGTERKIVTCVIASSGAVYLADIDPNCKRVYGTITYNF